VDSVWVRAMVVTAMYSFGLFLVFRRPASKERRRFQIGLAVVGGFVLLFVMVSRLLSA
jgi:hypothetical protein